MNLRPSHFVSAICLAIAVTPASALAIDPGACCVQSTSRLDSLMNPTKGSDEAFFSSGGAPPNVTLVLDTSCSMVAWPESWPSAEGCDHTFAGNGYVPGTPYRGVIQGIAADGSPIANPRWFDNEKIYSLNGSSVGHDLAGSPSVTTWSGTGTYDSARNDACNSIIPTSYANYASRRSACRTCVDTKGYFVRNNGGGSVSRIGSGNYLKYYAPRDVSALMVISQMLYDVREVRLSMLTFENWTNNGPRNCWRGGNYVCMWQLPAPSCDKLMPFDQTALTTSRNAVLAALNANNSFTTDTPVAASLYAAMYAMRSTGPVDSFTSMFGTFPQPHSPTADTVWNESADSKERRICPGCGFNAVIVLTDGEPNESMIASWPSAITAMDSVTATTCTGGGSCNSRLDEIAAYFWMNGDVRNDYPSAQRVATYTIGFGTNPSATRLLESAAAVGGGTYFGAKNASGIVGALQSIFEDINTRNTSFSSASVSAVQTGSSSTPAVLPRVVPKKDQAWAGALWRFEQYNEFVEDNDLNGDGDKADVFIVDKPCTGATPCAALADGGRPETADNIVTEDSNGLFIRQIGGAPAQPYWEANREMVAAGIDDRKVWTVVDRNGDGAFTNADEPLERVQLLPAGSSAGYDNRAADYMGIKGSDKCPNGVGSGALLTRMGLVTASAWGLTGLPTPPAPTQADYDRLCTRLVIMWTLGYDLLNADPARKSSMRADALGDVFHSSPIAVEPPFEPFLCDLGLSTQCARTLYANSGGSTPFTQQSTGTTVNVCNPVSSAYEVWLRKSHRRQRVILVGGNDGMLHAFDNGTSVVDADECVGGKPTTRYGAGTGREVWAFIPPDQLPRLADQMLGHQYMVDGDIMVRDIWHDANKDNLKDADEFHTLAVMSEGRGGTHYLALEVQFDEVADRVKTVKDRPGFRWMFPQPCSEEAATFGKTFFSLSPKAPPIGPVLFDNDTLHNNQKRTTGSPIERMAVPDAVERWVVALSGGWSPGLERGRGVYFVDAWEGRIGDRRDNLWWKFEFDEGATGDREPARGLRWSVTAPIALVDYGSDTQPQRDMFFDTAIWGDTAGQVWVARLHEPARFAHGTQLIENWTAARALELDRPAVAAGPSSIDNVQPFFYLPSVAIENGTDRLRAFIGSGNRYAVLERKAGMCRFDNPLACAKAGCDDTRVNYTREDGLVDITRLENHWQSGTFTSADSDYTVKRGVDDTLHYADMCGTVGTPRVLAEYTDFEASGCGMTNTSPGGINETKYQCGMLNGADGGFSCQRIFQTRSGALGDLLEYDNINDTGLGHNRFVGFWAYGAGRNFGGDAGSPASFDDARLSDRNGDLVDVTSVSCTTTSCTGGATASTDKGWFVNYTDVDQKTATGAAVIASCVLWSDLKPGVSLDAGSCATAPTSISSVYQADFITGQPNCAFGFLDGGTFARSQQRTVLAPPPEPASVVQVSKTGQVKYSAMLVEPGKSQATTVDVTGATDVLQVVYTLPITRALHNCRHSDGGCVTSP